MTLSGGLMKLTDLDRVIDRAAAKKMAAPPFILPVIVKAEAREHRYRVVDARGSVVSSRIGKDRAEFIAAAINDYREALTLLRKMRDSAIEVRAWRHGGKHGRWQAEAGPITATDATVHDALLLITPEDGR